MNKTNQIKYKQYIFRYTIEGVPNHLPWFPSIRSWGRTLREAKRNAKSNLESGAAIRTGEVRCIELLHGTRYHNPLSYKGAGSSIENAPTQYSVSYDNIDFLRQAIRDRHFSELRHTKTA